MELSRYINLRDRRSFYIALTAPVVAIAATRLLSTVLSTGSQTSGNILISPRHSLQLLSAQKLEDIPYPPNALPGARDVDTPYGNIRVYEWGPEDGRKVLFVHGISTPCIAFAGIAKRLVEKGCRVMLFDLFGRGYSDAPDPTTFKQDIRLFTTQILLVLSSSKLAWTGTDRFTMIGYSLGGGISAAFTSYLPELVESLILVAPGGLIRPEHISTTSQLLYNGWLPQFLVDYYVGRRLRSGVSTPPGVGKGKATGETPVTPVTPGKAAESEVPEHPAHASDSTAPIFPDRPRISVANAVRWQVDAHPGFLPSFISSIKFAPVSSEHERWRTIGRRLSAQKASSEPDKVQGLKEGKVLLLLGKQDGVIVADEVGEDATEALGEDNVKVVKLEGAHDVPIVNAEGCARAIFEFWEENGS